MTATAAPQHPYRSPTAAPQHQYRSPTAAPQHQYRSPTAAQSQHHKQLMHPNPRMADKSPCTTQHNTG